MTAGEVRGSAISAIDDLLGGPTKPLPPDDPKPSRPASAKAAAKKAAPVKKAAAKKSAAAVKEAAVQVPASVAVASSVIVPRLRRLVNVPLAIKRQTEERAANADLYISDYILEAFQRQAPAVRSELAKPAKKANHDPFATPPRRNRRRVEDPTQLVFTAPIEAADAIDELADQCSLTRSALVTIVLERDLAAATQPS